MLLLLFFRRKKKRTGNECLNCLYIQSKIIKTCLQKKNNRREFFFNDTVCILKECLCNLHNSRHGASWEYRSQTKSNSFIKTHKLFTLFGRTFGRATFAIRCKYSSDIPLPMRVALRAHERHTSPLPSILLEKQTIKK